MSRPNYMIYPSLLDAFTAFRTADYMTEDELLARINRTGGTSPEAMRGTAFNEVVDHLVAGHAVDLVVDGPTGAECYTYLYERERYIFLAGCAKGWRISTVALSHSSMSRATS